MQVTDPVLVKMDHYLHNWKSVQDPRHVFLSCYKMMSANMVLAIKRKEFNDLVWVNKLLTRFANYYFESLTCYDCGEQTPKVWDHVHKTTCSNNLSDIQVLILGVNAHINYDLVLALYDLLTPEWQQLSKAQREQRYKDHCHVNQVIANTIDQVQDEVLEPLNPALKWIDNLFFRIDEYLISKLIASWREAVWENTLLMLAMQSQEEREQFRIRLEKSVLARGETICVF